jgi:hypothetical protein
MKNKMLVIVATLIVIVIAGLLFVTRSIQTEQIVLESTYDQSKEYLLLRHRTDNILLNARNYADYPTWSADMTTLIQDWKELENNSKGLEESANKTAASVAVYFPSVQTAKAYTAKEVSDIYDKAPKFKGIATLAKHLGVDAKRAQLILNQVQAETSSEVFTEEGDAFETLENTAIVVKDGCKVVGFVGGVVLTGGVGGLATAGALTQASVVIVGADLALEVTEDGAQIAMGDRNKVSSFVKDVRTITEPIATVLTITSIPSNLGSAYGKFDSVMVGLEQFRDSVQEGKVVGVDLRNFEYQKPFQRIRQAKYPGTVSAAEMEMAEVEEWIKSLNKDYKPMTKEEAVDFLKSTNKETKQEKATIEQDNKTEPTKKSGNDGENNSLNNTAWKGTVESIAGGSDEKQTIEFDFVLNEDGTVNGGNFKKWTQLGDRLKVFGEDESKGYFEFKVKENELLLTKMLIGDELIQPGEKYMGGIAPWGFLYKKEGSAGSDPQASGDAMPISEFNEMSDDGIFTNISKVTENLGEPDVKTTDNNGRIIYVYYDLVKYDNGNLGSVKMAFYNEEDYRSYIEGSGASWESNKETWDDSGGGIRAHEEIRSGDTYKNMYGN